MAIELRGIDVGDLLNKDFNIRPLKQQGEVLKLKYIAEVSESGEVIGTAPMFHDDDDKEVFIFQGLLWKEIK